MANTHRTLTELFSNIADAIREKKNTTETIVADTFPVEIKNLKTGFDYINQDVTIIPNEAFYNCEDMKSVDCYNLISIGASAFENCKNLKTVILYDNVESVGENVFKGCSEDLTIYCMFDSQPETWHENWNPDNCEVIWLYETPIKTWDCSASNEDSVTVKMYNGITDRQNLLFIDGNGNMKNYTEPAAVPWWDYLFTKIKFIKINNEITNIGDYAFFTCQQLCSLTIPDSIINIGTYALGTCKSLTSITYTGTVAQWNAITFGNYWNYNTGNYTIHCTDGDIAKDGTITYHSNE